MPLLNILGQLRSNEDPRFREQGFTHSGTGIAERYRRNAGFWDSHLQHNRIAISDAAHLLGSDIGGTLLVLGAGRLLDIPYVSLFQKFKRVVLLDADFACSTEQRRLLEQARLTATEFRACDLTGTVVDEAAHAQSIIRTSSNPTDAARALSAHFLNLEAPMPAWTREFQDVRFVTSSNLLSQLGYFPRTHIMGEFKKRFGKALDDFPPASETLEAYLHRVRSQHVEALTRFPNAGAFLSADYKVVTYELDHGLREPPSGAEIQVNEAGESVFKFPVRYTEQSDPLYGQVLRNLWPKDTRLEGPNRWAWHIIPQGSEKKNLEYGRIHLVEAWIKRP